MSVSMTLLRAMTIGLVFLPAFNFVYMVAAYDAKPPRVANPYWLGLNQSLLGLLAVWMAQGVQPAWVRASAGLFGLPYLLIHFGIVKDLSSTETFYVLLGFLFVFIACGLMPIRLRHIESPAPLADERRKSFQFTIRGLLLATFFLAVSLVMLPALSRYLIDQGWFLTTCICSAALAPASLWATMGQSRFALPCIVVLGVAEFAAYAIASATARPYTWMATYFTTEIIITLGVLLAFRADGYRLKWLTDPVGDAQSIEP